MRIDKNDVDVLGSQSSISNIGNHFAVNNQDYTGVEMTDKNKADQGKPPISLVPTGIIWEIAKVRDYGVNVKYPETGREGWREVGEERLRNAMLRHILRYLDDPDGVDDESGLPHISHAACGMAFLIELMKGRCDK